MFSNRFPEHVVFLGLVQQTDSPAPNSRHWLFQCCGIDAQTNRLMHFSGEPTYKLLIIVPFALGGKKVAHTLLLLDGLACSFSCKTNTESVAKHS